MIRNPRVAFDMLFGAGGTARMRAGARADAPQHPRLDPRRSRRAQAQLGAGRPQRIDRYLDNVRELERRIQAVEARNTSGEERELPRRAGGVPDSFAEHMKLMFDIQVLALAVGHDARHLVQDGARRARTACSRRAASNKAFHPASHHGDSESGILDFNKINRYHVSMLPVLPRQDEEHEGRRQQPARQDGDHLGIADGRRQRAQPSPLPAAAARPRQRRAQGQHAPQGAGRDADGERDADRSCTSSAWTT